MDTHQLFVEINAMLLAAVFLSKDTNPVCRKRHTNILHVLGQYSLFPKAIVSMLTLARERAMRMGWIAVASELDRNINQELGSDSGGVTHYQLLANAMRAEFDVNIWGVSPTESTESFIFSMRAGLKNENPFFVAGVAYALESSACPELEVVLHLVQKEKGGPLEPATNHFFARHINAWEPSHEQELRLTVEPLFKEEGEEEENQIQFFAWVEYTLLAMRDWWNKLAKEARRKE